MKGIGYENHSKPTCSSIKKKSNIIVIIEFNVLALLKNNINYIKKIYLTVEILKLKWFFDMISEP